MPRFNGVTGKAFVVNLVQYLVAGVIATCVSPWLGVFVAMIRIDI